MYFPQSLPCLWCVDRTSGLQLERSAAPALLTSHICYSGGRYTDTILQFSILTRSEQRFRIISVTWKNFEV